MNKHLAVSTSPHENQSSLSLQNGEQDSSNDSAKPLIGAGLGFRRELLSQMTEFGLKDDLVSKDNQDLNDNLVSKGNKGSQPFNLDSHSSTSMAQKIDFFELSPENWLNPTGELGGHYQHQLRAYTERYPFVCHGLSLSIGSAAKLDKDLLLNIKRFMQTHDISLYTEHLSWCSDTAGHLYDLLPIPCTQEAVHWVADRIKRAQDIMGRQIGFENASYYFVPPHSDMSDSEFISAVAEEADCLLHLDVNNIYVNSKNFGFDPHAYLRELPLERTCYMHVAGHYVDDDGLIIDTHGSEVIHPVWDLLSDAYQLIELKTGKPASSIPTCLERDFNFPTIDELISEVQMIKSLQHNPSLSLQNQPDQSPLSNKIGVAGLNHDTV